MKKVALLLAIVLILSVPLSVHAATPREITIRPGLTFNGSQATCTVTIVGNNTSERIEATIKLWEDGRCVETWTPSGNGYIFFSQNADAEKSSTYKLTVVATFNGVTQPTVSFEKKYE